MRRTGGIRKDPDHVRVGCVMLTAGVMIAVDLILTVALLL